MHLKFDNNIFLLWVFLILQVVVVICYLSFSYSWKDGKIVQPEALPSSVRFIGKNSKLGSNRYKIYYNADLDEEIYLRSENVNDYFTLVNNTVCFIFGTDIQFMQRNTGILKGNGKCECLPGYHGNDCSLPEVIWRAFIASRQETVIRKRIGETRRIIHLFHIAHSAHTQAAVITISELFHVVDLFIITETNETDYGETKPLYFKQKLDKGLLKDKQYKILYVPLCRGKGSIKTQFKNENEVFFEKFMKTVKNIREDDLFIQFNHSEVANSKALMFFKLYDGFSLPLHFRLKWNVYGFYFQHPNKTKTVTSGYTRRMLEELYKNNRYSIEYDRGLTVGDLNHYGGWLCELCYDPKDILNIVQTFTDFSDILLRSSNLIDMTYIEELIGDGLYVDGKTVLIKTNINHDPYFSPSYVSNNSWKFDSLVTNFYNKLDYN